MRFQFGAVKKADIGLKLLQKFLASLVGYSEH